VIEYDPSKNIALNIMGNQKTDSLISEWAERVLVTRGVPGEHQHIKEITEDYDVSSSVISRELRRVGIEVDSYLQNHLGLMLQLYEEGIGMRRIGTLFGTYAGTVSDLFSKNDLNAMSGMEGTHGVSVKERFEAKFEVVEKTGCWIWVATTDESGYGCFTYKGRKARAHRVSLQIYEDKYPGDLLVLHQCDIPGCVNPDHLRIGTHQENVDEYNRRGDPELLEEGRRGRSLSLGRLTPPQVIQVRRKYWVMDLTQEEIAESLPITKSALNRLLKGDTYSWLPIWPPYADEPPTGDEVLRALRAS